MRHGFNASLRIGLSGLLIVLCGVAPATAHAQFGRGGLTGQIVAIRGDIVQIRPQYSTKLTRVVIDAKTTIDNPQMTSPAQLQPGIFVSVLGDYTDDGGILPRFVMAQDERTGFFSSKSHGVHAVGYGRSAFLGGKLKSANPLVVTDDDGKDYTIPVKGFLPVMHMARGDRNMLQVGKTVTAVGEKTADGLLHARSIQIQQLPGSSGTVFGTVVAIRGNTLEIQPRFGEENIQATISPDAQLLRQIDIDPDTVKVGDIITVQGKRLAGAPEDSNAIVAAVLLPGKQTYPKVGGGGFFAMMLGAGNPGMTCTGKVASLSPFLLTQDDGKQVIATIPGQTPIVDLRTITPADIKPGDKLMVSGAEDKAGGLVIKLLMLGASPIVGLGD